MGAVAGETAAALETSGPFHPVDGPERAAPGTCPWTTPGAGRATRVGASRPVAMLVAPPPAGRSRVAATPGAAAAGWSGGAATRLLGSESVSAAGRRGFA